MPALPNGSAGGQEIGPLPTPLPQPFSPNGVLRPIIPIQPALPIPSMRPLAVIPLPTPAPVLRITPLKTPSSTVAAQAQGLIKQVPVHRRWPVLQPRDVPKPAAAGGAAASGGGASGGGASGGGASGVSHSFNAGNVPGHRRPLGW